jgi:integrase
LTNAKHGAQTRQAVYSGKRRVPGLYERTLADGVKVYDVALRLGGRVRRHRLEARTKTDALAELRALQVDYERGEQHRSAAAALTVAELASDWLVHLESRVGHRDPRRRYSARTVALYRQRMVQHIIPAFGSRAATEVGLSDVRRLIDQLGLAGLAPSTVTGIIGILSGLFRYGIKSGVLERNVVRDLDRDDRPGTARLTEPRYLTTGEIARLLENLSDTFRPIVAVCTFAALRISEVLGLRWRDVDLNAGKLTVSGQLGPSGTRVPVKSSASSADVDLLPALARELRDHRARQASRELCRVHAGALVFTTARGKPQSRRNALRAVHRAGSAAGLNPDGREPVGLHDLRHSFAAAALEQLSLPEASFLLRHANARVTAQIYAGLTDDARKQAAGKLAKAGFGR